jgi:predicted enzyme related to lactoylglutathione lyase
VDATAKKAKKLGGRLCVAPMDIPEVGRFCVIEDPQGAVIAAITYHMK